MTAASQPHGRTVHHDDYAARMERVVDRRGEAGRADGVLVTPGPDLVWLTGYQPTAITERLTMLVLTPDHEPTLLVPASSDPMPRPPRARRPLTILDWADGADPYAAAAPAPATRTARYGISDSAWAMHLLGLQRVAAGHARTGR